MAGQSPSRRELLQALGLASAASLFPGFSRWHYALAEMQAQHTHGNSTHTHVTTAYRPQFFTGAQYQTLELLTDLILPASQGRVASHGKATAHILQPGAKEAGVAEFIDFMVFSDAGLQVPFRAGLKWLDDASSPAASFHALPSPQQTTLLEQLAYKAKQRDGQEEGQRFFKLVRRYTVMGFYTTRIGLESLDYPGLTFYGTSPGCTHDDNPEHIGL